MSTVSVAHRHLGRQIGGLSIVAVVVVLVAAQPAAAQTGANRGDLHVLISGLPAGERPLVTVTGVGNFRRTFRRQGQFVLRRVLIGRYTITARKLRFRRSTRAGAVRRLTALPDYDCAPRGGCTGKRTVQVTSVGFPRVLEVRYTSGRARGAPRFTQFATDGSGLCGLRRDGIARCWGGHPFVQVPPPAGRFIQIFSGDGGFCGLRPDRSAVCAGSPSRRGKRLTSISSDLGLACGIDTSDRITCWGSSARRARVPRGRFSQVAVGRGGEGTAVCGLRTDGSVACGTDSTFLPPGSLISIIGGGNLAGLQPDGSAWDEFSPLPGTFTQLTVGGACGLRTDGASVCRGFDSDGPPVVEPGPFVQLFADASGSTACGLRPDRTLRCFLKDPADPNNRPGEDSTRAPRRWERLPRN